MNYLAAVAQYVVLHCQTDEQANKQSLIINCGLLIECRSSAKFMKLWIILLIYRVDPNFKYLKKNFLKFSFLNQKLSMHTRF